jgi:hypothetical protein
VVEAGSVTKEQLGLLMAGVAPEQALSSPETM